MSATELFTEPGRGPRPGARAANIHDAWPRPGWGPVATFFSTSRAGLIVAVCDDETDHAAAPSTIEPALLVEHVSLVWMVCAFADPEDQSQSRAGFRPRPSRSC
jgi:hypothetical protein